MSNDAAGGVKLAAVVNSFNRRELLVACLQSLTAAFRTLPFPSAIVVYEAGSTDGSMDVVRDFQARSASPEIIVVVPAPGDDSSFAAGVNGGCREAILRYPSVEYLLLFETDNLVTSSEPIALAARLLDSHRELGAAGFTVTKRSGEPAGFGCSFPSVLQFLLGQQLTQAFHLDGPRLSTEAPFEGHGWGICDVVYTSPLLIRRAAWEKTEGMDAAAFPYSDSDLDWCWRARQAGWKAAVVHIKGVIHDNDQQLSNWSARRVINFHKARLRLLQRHLHSGGPLLKLGLLTRHVFEFAALAIGSPMLSNPRESLKKRLALITSVMHGYHA